jgi:EAL domain-containing protein (putative c-di-GMP-specific phosphodiesterase class I)/CheY-like chemotaxis protein
MRLLVLDDDVDVSATICTIAARAGFETRSTTQADEFFQLVADWQPSHLIVDLVMPDIDGVETLHRLALSGHRGIVIVTSGLGGRVLEAASRAAEENGLRVSGVLPKPFTAAKLRSLLHQDLDGRKQTAADVGVVAPVNADMLATALATKQLCVHYQPKIVCTTEKVVGFESLVRWQHPVRGLLQPGHFIRVAEESGLIVPLGYWVIHAACKYLNELSAKGYDHIQIAVNVAFKQFQDSNFVRTVANIIRKHDIAPGRLEFELTETTMMIEGSAVDQSLRQLSELGIAISLDDFGTGYASLGYLKRLPLTQLKIDQSFVRDLLLDPNDEAIVRTILALGHSLDLRVLAEGVENQALAERLTEMGCQYFQGYYFSRPQPESYWREEQSLARIDGAVSVVDRSAQGPAD